MVDNGTALAFFDKSMDTGCCDGRVMTTSDGEDVSALISSIKNKIFRIIIDASVSFRSY